jgi:hypothetical protein
METLPQEGTAIFFFFLAVNNNYFINYIKNIKLKAQCAEPVSLTFHSALRNLKSNRWH